MTCACCMINAGKSRKSLFFVLELVLVLVLVLARSVLFIENRILLTIMLEITKVNIT